MKLVAVMPAYNEASRVAAAILGVRPFVDEIVVVDDASRDETSAKAMEAGATVVRHAVNRGQGAALKTGNLAALMLGADIVIHVDADGQQDPAFLRELVAPIKAGAADVVFGSRFLNVSAEGMPLARRLVLKLGRIFNAYALGIPKRVTDPQNGLRAMSAEAVRSIDFRQDEFAHCSEILRLVTRSKFRWQEVPMRVRYTAETLGKGKKPRAFSIVWQLFLGAFDR